MSPTFTIQRVEEKESFTTDHGTFNVYSCLFGNETQTLDAEWNRKEGTPAPEVGETVEGTMEKGQYGWRFKKSYSNAPSNGSMPENPRKSAEILRMHSQHMALLHIEGMERRATPEKPFSIGSMEQVKGIVAWFDLDVREAGEKV